MWSNVWPALCFMKAKQCFVGLYLQRTVENLKAENDQLKTGGLSPCPSPGPSSSVSQSSSLTALGGLSPRQSVAVHMPRGYNRGSDGSSSGTSHSLTCRCAKWLWHTVYVYVCHNVMNVNSVFLYWIVLPRKSFNFWSILSFLTTFVTFSNKFKIYLIKAFLINECFLFHKSICIYAFFLKIK